MADGIDTLILGCTHYPLLSGLLQLELGPDVVLVSSAEETAKDVYAVARWTTACSDEDAVGRPTTSSSRPAIPTRSSASPGSSWGRSSTDVGAAQAQPVGGGVVELTVLGIVGHLARPAGGATCGYLVSATRARTSGSTPAPARSRGSRSTSPSTRSPRS